MKPEPMPQGADGADSQMGPGDIESAVDDRASGDDRPSGEVPEAAALIFRDRLPVAERYHEWLAGPGTERGLMGPREIPRLWDRHILNSAVLAEAIEPAVRVLDIGSGAGLPGIPLAIARPDLTVVLIEPLERRANFLTEVIADLELDVTVVRGRAEEKAIISAHGGADVVTSRALAPLDRLAKWSAPLLRNGGQMVAIKGSSAADEIAEHGATLTRIGLRDPAVSLVGVTRLPTPTTLLTATRSGATRRSRRGPR